MRGKSQPCFCDDSDGFWLGLGFGLLLSDSSGFWLGFRPRYRNIVRAPSMFAQRLLWRLARPVVQRCFSDCGFSCMTVRFSCDLYWPGADNGEVWSAAPPARLSSSVLPSVRSPPGHSPFLASWTTNSHLQDIPLGLLATWLRAEGLMVTAGGQRVPSRWAWGPSVSQTASSAKTPSYRHRNGAPVEPKVIRVLIRQQARALSPKVVRGHLQMAQGPRQMQGLVRLVYV